MSKADPWDGFDELAAEPLVTPHVHARRTDDVELPKGALAKVLAWAQENQLLAAVALWLLWQAGFVQPWVEKTTGITIPTQVDATVDLRPINDKLEGMAESIDKLVVKLEAMEQTRHTHDDAVLRALLALGGKNAAVEPEPEPDPKPKPRRRRP